MDNIRIFFLVCFLVKQFPLCNSTSQNGNVRMRTRIIVPGRQCVNKVASFQLTKKQNCKIKSPPPLYAIFMVSKRWDTF